MKRLPVAAVTAAALVGCWIGGPSSGSNGDGGVSGNEGGAGLTGLPCEVSDVLTRYCASCHGASNPSSGTSLASYADLTAMAKSDPAKTEAALSVERMKNGSMPSGASKPTTAEISAFEAWVAGGMQQGSCGNPANDPFAGPHTCTSGKKYSFGESAAMEPGKACIACHKTKPGAPPFAIAGTVYPSGHEPDRCIGSGAAGALVVVTDKDGKKYNLPVNSAGNFAAAGALALPYTAEVQYMGKTRAMAAAQTDGDCNGCHTENGANGAPGRIVLP